MYSMFLYLSSQLNLQTQVECVWYLNDLLDLPNLTYHVWYSNCLLASSKYWANVSDIPTVCLIYLISGQDIGKNCKNLFNYHATNYLHTGQMCLVFKWPYLNTEQMCIVFKWPYLNVLGKCD